MGCASARDGRDRELVDEMQVQSYLRQQERAFTLLSSSGAEKAFDIASEPAALRSRSAAIS